MISVIIPMYNSEKYINKCLKSVLNQTFDNYEIIVVNDGSTDSSPSLVKKIEENSEKVRIINQNNQGPSKSRNRGLEEARGDYICFVDSDDYVEKNYLAVLYKAITIENVQLSSIMMKRNVINDLETIESNISVENIERGIVEKKRFLECMSEAFYNVFYGSQCNKIYDAKIIKENNIKFNTDISLAEDLMFNLEYLRHVNNIYISDSYCYHYNQDNVDSLTKTDDVWYLWEMAKARFNYCSKMYMEMGEYYSCEKNIDTALAVELIAPTYYIVKENYSGFKNAKDQLKKLYKEKTIKKALKNNKKKNMVHRIARVSLSIHSYSLFVFLMRAWIKVQKYEN